MLRAPSYFRYYTDVSGIPCTRDCNTGNYQDVIIGMASISKNYIDTLITSFKQKYPSYWDKKGNQLNKKELENIINFLDKNHVMMLTIIFEHKDWDKYRQMYPNETNFREKVMAILYFFILKKLVKKKFIHEAVLDNDTNFGIFQCIICCKRLLNMYDYNIDITLGHREINPELRFADWIAQARRKISIKHLSKYNNFIILKNRLPHPLIILIFKSQKVIRSRLHSMQEPASGSTSHSPSD